MHPVISVPSLQHAPHDLKGLCCAIEGDEPGCSQLASLASAAGLKPFRIEGERKALYHAAAVVASNYFIAVEEMALAVYEESGVPREMALELLHPFLQGALDNLRKSSRGSALSGPIARGDKETVERHLHALENHQRWIEIYRLLGQEALDLVRTRGDWKKEHDELKAVLGGEPPPHIPGEVPE